MILRDFSGGINTRIAPSLINPNEAQILTNVDASSGSIRPIKDSKLYLETVNKYFTYYYAKNKFYSKSTESSFVEYKDILYITNANSYPTKYDGVNEHRLGIVKPSLAPSISASSTGASLNGTYTYAITYYNSLTGVESQPSPISAELTVSGVAITVTVNSASSDSQVNTIRLYRIGGNIVKYSLVQDFSNAAFTFTDTIPDLTVAGSHVLDTFTYSEAPTNLKYLTEGYAMLFGAVGDKLYFSEVALPNAWPVTNYLDFDVTITGIGMVQNGLLVFTKFKTYIITGNSPSTLSKYLLDGSQGCLSHYTIQFVKGSLLWLSQDGVCSSTGGLVEIVTLNKLGKIILTGVQNAQVLDSVYYLLHSEGMLVIDARYNLMIRTIKYQAEWIGAYLDKLLLVSNSSLYEAFAGDIYLPYVYKTGVLTEESYSNYKHFKDFYIKYFGDIHIKLYIDGTLLNEADISGAGCFNLKADSTACGYGAEIEISGTGEVSEIEYTALRRQNGK